VGHHIAEKQISGVIGTACKHYIINDTPAAQQTPINHLLSDNEAYTKLQTDCSLC